MKPEDVEKLLVKNPNVDKAAIRDFYKSLKKKDNTGTRGIPSPYGRKLPGYEDSGWHAPKRRVGG